MHHITAKLIVAAAALSAAGCQGPKGDRGDPGEQGLQGPTGPMPIVAANGGVLGTGTSSDPLRIDLAAFTGVSRSCGNGEGTQVFNGATWGPCILQAGQCQIDTAPGCSRATAATTCKTLKATAGFAGGDGVYWIDPDGTGGATPFEAWCDMTTAGGGWTRVFSVVAPAIGCALGTAASSDPLARNNCAKLSDVVINQLASERVFYTQFEGAPKLFTRYTGVLSSQANAVTTIGQVVNKESYAAVMADTPSFTPVYTGFRLFSQHNWYEADTQLGSRASSCRVSLEYLADSANAKYACCSPDCSASARTGWLTAYVK